MSQSDIDTKIKVDLSIKEPPIFKVIYMNDDVTSMDFVAQTLIDFFDYDHETAMIITDGIHTAGSAVVARLPFEIAEQKGIEITICARAESFPLLIKLEPEANK